FLEDGHFQLIAGLALILDEVDEPDMLSGQHDFDAVIHPRPRLQGDAGVQRALEIRLDALDGFGIHRAAPLAGAGALPGSSNGANPADKGSREWRIGSSSMGNTIPHSLIPIPSS